MAKWIEWTAEQIKAWEEWLATRPPIIVELARRFPGDRLYRLQSSGHRVTIHSYCEDGTLIVNVTGEFNRVAFSRCVFNISPEDLQECDLPGPEEDLGDTSAEAGYSQEDVENIVIPKLRKHLECERIARERRN